MFIGNFYIFFGGMSVQIPCPFKNWVTSLSVVVKVSYTLYLLNPCKIYGLQLISSILWVVFSLPGCPLILNIFKIQEPADTYLLPQLRKE